MNICQMLITILFLYTSSMWFQVRWASKVFFPGYVKAYMHAWHIVCVKNTAHEMYGPQPALISKVKIVKEASYSVGCN